MDTSSGGSSAVSSAASSDPEGASHASLPSNALPSDAHPRPPKRLKRAPTKHAFLDSGPNLVWRQLKPGGIFQSADDLLDTLAEHHKSTAQPSRKFRVMKTLMFTTKRKQNGKICCMRDMWRLRKVQAEKRDAKQNGDPAPHGSYCNCELCTINCGYEVVFSAINSVLLQKDSSLTVAEEVKRNIHQHECPVLITKLKGHTCKKDAKEPLTSKGDSSRKRRRSPLSKKRVARITQEVSERLLDSSFASGHRKSRVVSDTAASFSHELL